MKKVIRIGVVILTVIFVGSIIWSLYDIHQEVSNNQNFTQKMFNISDQTDSYFIRKIQDLQKNLLINSENIANVNRDLTISVNNQFQINDILNNKIKNLPQKQRYDALVLQKKLQQINIMIVNQTVGGLGSGVTLKYNDKFYILTAGHMADDDNDALELWENKQKICDLKIIKHNYNLNDNTSVDVAQDLMLCVPTDETIKPRYYVELAEYEPVTSDKVLIVGNPTGVEDVYSEGRIAKYEGNFMYFRDSTYFGNSGGGIFNQEGKLVGIMSHLLPYPNFQPSLPPFTLEGAVRLSIIKSFLEGVQ